MTWQTTQNLTWMPSTSMSRALFHSMAMLPLGIIHQTQETMPQTRLTRDLSPPQHYARMRSQIPQGAKVHLTRVRIAPRWVQSMTRAPLPSVQPRLRASDLAWQVLESIIPGLNQHLVTITLRLPPRGAMSSLLLLQVRPHLRMAHLRLETIITRNSPSWRGLLQVARRCLSTTPKVRRTQTQVWIIASRRSLSFPQILIYIQEAGLGMLPIAHSLRALLVMARTPPVTNRITTFMSVVEILEMIALH